MFLSPPYQRNRLSPSVIRPIQPVIKTNFDKRPRRSFFKTEPWRHHMSATDIYNENGKELDQRLRLRSFPLAVKLLTSEKEIPSGVKRPKRDFGYHLSACQSFYTLRSRYSEDLSIAMLKEDMWCPEAVIGYGMTEVPEYFLEGHTRFPAVVNSLEAGKNWAHAFPRLEPGKCIGILAARMATAQFKPDVVVIYCNSLQLRALLQAAAWETGKDPVCRMSAAGACVYGVVPSIQSGECHVAVPCTGDRKWAMAQDDEMIFSIPERKLEGLIKAFRYSDSHGRPMASRPRLMPEYKLEDSYAKVAKLMGMEIN